MLNHIQVINVCKICNNGFTKKEGYKVENPDDYEVDLFICKDCRKKHKVYKRVKSLVEDNKYIFREYKIFWKSTKRAESKILADSLNEAKRIHNHIDKRDNFDFGFEVTEDEEIWEVDYIENSYDE